MIHGQDTEEPGEKLGAEPVAEAEEIKALQKSFYKKIRRMLALQGQKAKAEKGTSVHAKAQVQLTKRNAVPAPAHPTQPSLKLNPVNTILIPKPEARVEFAKGKQPLCHQVSTLLSIPNYRFSANRSTKPEPNQYCFEYNAGKVQYRFLNQQGEETTHILNKEDFQSLGGLSFNLNRDTLKESRRKLMSIVNPRALARFDYEETLHCRLLKRPEHFHSEMQAQIYAKFLFEYNDVVNTPEGLCHLRVIYHPLLVDLYKRVNAVFDVLYQNQPAPLTLSAGELLFVDTLLYQTIVDEFKRYQFYSLFELSWIPPRVNVELDEHSLYLNLNELMISVARQPIREMILDTVGNLEVKEREIEKLTESRNLLAEQNAEKTAAMAEKDALLNEQKRTIEKLKKALREKDNELASRDQEIASRGQKIAEYQKATRLQKQQIMKLEEKVQQMEEDSIDTERQMALQQTLIDELQKELKELQKQRPQTGSGFFGKGAGASTSSGHSQKHTAGGTSNAR